MPLRKLLYRNDLPKPLLMVQSHRSVMVPTAKAMTKDVHMALPVLPVKHGKHEHVLPLLLEFPLLPTRPIISAKQINKISNLLLRHAQVLASMVSEPETIASHMLLGPHHVIGVVIEEEVHQSPLRVFLSAEEAVLAVFPPLTAPEQYFPPCMCKPMQILPISSKSLSPCMLTT